MSRPALAPLAAQAGVSEPVLTTNDPLSRATVRSVTHLSSQEVSIDQPELQFVHSAALTGYLPVFEA